MLPPLRDSVRDAKALSTAGPGVPGGLTVCALSPAPLSGVAAPTLLPLSDAMPLHTCALWTGDMSFKVILNIFLLVFLLVV